MIHFLGFFDEWKVKNNQLFDMENFLNIVNVFTGTFNKLYVSLLKKTSGSWLGTSTVWKRSLFNFQESFFTQEIKVNMKSNLISVNF